MVAVTADAPGCDAAFLTPQQLVEHLDLPASTRALFILDQWSHPAAGDAASDSPDLVLTVEALRERRAITASVTGRTRDDHLRDRMEHIGGWAPTGKAAEVSDASHGRSR